MGEGGKEKGERQEEKWSGESGEGRKKIGYV